MGIYAGYQLPLGLNAEFLQVADINASTTKEWEGGAGFSPIGDSGSQFTGVFNGGGHLIHNLFIERPATSTIGMFGRVTGKITDLSLIDLNVTGKSTVGGLVAFPQGEITRCYVSGWVSFLEVGLAGWQAVCQIPE